MSNFIYVPVTLKAIMVGKPPEQDAFADISDDFSRVIFDSLGEYVPAQLSARKDMAKGIHLHWSLPDAFTRGEYDEEKDTAVFPAVPNRWIIARFMFDGTSINVRYFFTESDALNEERDAEYFNIGSYALPNTSGALNKESKKSFLYLGRTFPLDKTPDRPTGYIEKLTAVIPGNPVYSAYYPTCRNVFGFYDDMTDSEGNLIKADKDLPANISYAVAGFFSNPQNDPLFQNNLNEVIEKFNWKIATKKEVDLYSARTLCHGILCNVHWLGNEEVYKSSAPSEEYEIAVGNTSAEALAAMLRHKMKKVTDNNTVVDDNTEKMICHLLSGFPKEILDKDGVVNSEEMLFEATFRSISPFKCYGLKYNNENANDETANNDTLGEQIPIPDDLSNRCAELNKYLREYAEYEAETEYLREVLYDEWFRCQKKSDRNHNELNRLIHEIKINTGKLKSQQASLFNYENNLQNSAKNQGFRLIEQSGERFYEPLAPVILFSNINRNYSHGSDGRFSPDGKLIIRTETIGSISIPLKEDCWQVNLADVIKNTDLQFLQKDYPDIPLPGVINIFSEAVALSPNFLKFFAPENTDDDEINNAFDVLVLAILGGTLDSPIDNGENKLNITIADAFFPEKTAVSFFRQTWQPMYLEWLVDFYPDQNTVKEKPSLENWMRVGDDFTVAQDKVKIRLITGSSFSGRSLLTPHISQILKEKTDDLNINIRNAGAISVLSQAISDFHQNLIQKSTQIMPESFELSENSDIKEALKNYVPEFPLFDRLFAPIRAGIMNIRRICLIDVFGQLLEYAPLAVVRAESMRNTIEDLGMSEKSFLGKNIYLQPRLLFPARLSFALDGSEKDAVCAWLTLNKLDNNLWIFLPDGNCLGILQIVHEEVHGEARKKVVFKNPPDKGAGNIDTNSIADDDLKGFINAFINWPARFQTMFDCINKELENINPTTSSSYGSLSVFLGRPLTIVRTKAAIETFGHRREYKAFDIEKALFFNSVNTDKIAISATVGYEEKYSDGLVGFFLNRKYDVFHRTASINRIADEPTNGDNYLSNKSDLTVELDGDPVSLTLLLDPMGEAYLRCGILPSKKIRLSPSYFEPILRNIKHYIYAGPSLQKPDKIRLPFPLIDGKSWEWVGHVPENQDCEIVPADFKAWFSGDAIYALEGWLALKEKI